MGTKATPIVSDNAPIQFREAVWDDRTELHVARLNAHRSFVLVSTYFLYGVMMVVTESWSILFASSLAVAVAAYVIWAMWKSADFVRAHYVPPNPDDPCEVGMVQIHLSVQIGEHVPIQQTYGEDVGFLTLSDGYFHFEGTQTRFSIHRSRLRAEGVFLRLVGDSAYSMIVSSIRSAGPRRGLRVPSRTELQRRIAGFLSDSSVSSEPIEIYEAPPLRPSLGWLTMIRRHRTFFDVAFLVYCAGFIHSLHSLRAMIVLIGFVALWWIGLRSYLFSRRIRALERLRDEPATKLIVAGDRV